MNKIIEIDKIEEKELVFLANELRNGKIFVLPTSTIYGICCNALNKDAVKKVYDLKKRESNKPLIVLVDSLDMLNDITYGLNNLEQKIVSKFWPGPLTIILKKKDIVPNIVTANSDTLGIRIDSNEIVNKLIERSRVPIVAPSANISGNNNIESIEDLEKEIVEKVDYIIDCGRIENKLESTLIKVENNEINILREGKIKRKEIEEFE